MSCDILTQIEIEIGLVYLCPKSGISLIKDVPVMMDGDACDDVCLPWM